MKRPFERGERLILRSVPDDFYNGLDQEDVTAIKGQIGKHVYFCDMTWMVDVEVEFWDESGVQHWLWLPPFCLEQEE